MPNCLDTICCGSCRYWHRPKEYVKNSKYGMCHKDKQNKKRKAIFDRCEKFKETKDRCRLFSGV